MLYVADCACIYTICDSHGMLCVCVQDEVFNHIEAAEMSKVREQVTGKRTWLNTNMTACHLLPKTTDPPITCAQIKAELKVPNCNATGSLCHNYCYDFTHEYTLNIEDLFYTQLLETTCQPIVNKPKPKVEPPKDETPNEEPVSEEAAKEGEKMEEEPQPTGDDSKTDDMDLD